MDDLILAGAAGLFVLFLAGLIIAYCGFILAKAAIGALLAGDLAFAGIAAAAVILAGCLYAGTGVWLSRTERI